MPGYQEFIEDTEYASSTPGAVVGIRFTRRSDNAVFEAICTGCTPTFAREQLPRETVGNVNPTEIVEGRNNVTVSFNGYFSAKISDTFLMNSQDWGNAQFDVHRYFTTGKGTGVTAHPYEEIILDVYMGWSMANQTTPQGGRNQLTFDVSGPALTRMTGLQYATQGGLM